MVGSSNLSVRANFSYRDNSLARFSFPTLLRNQVVAGEMRAPGVLPGGHYSYPRNNLETIRGQFRTDEGRGEAVRQLAASQLPIAGM